jgi:hypothetical protein
MKYLIVMPQCQTLRNYNVNYIHSWAKSHKLNTMLKRLKQLREKVKSKFKGEKSKPATLPLVVTSYSQPHVLEQRMRERGMTHGTKTLVDINEIRVEKRQIPNMQGKKETQNVIFFCPLMLHGIKIHEKLAEGDGNPIPHDVVFNGITGPIPESEQRNSFIVSLKNVILDSNGSISITATPETKWELVGE